MTTTAVEYKSEPALSVYPFESPSSYYRILDTTKAHHYNRVIGSPRSGTFLQGPYARKTEITPWLGHSRRTIDFDVFVGSLGIEFKMLRPRHSTVSDLVAELDEETREALFQALRDAWKRDSGLMSSATRILNHPAYRLIIMFGRTMVPFIVKDLRSEFAHWFRALRILTGYTPTIEDRQNMGRMHAAWLAWADDNEKLAESPRTNE